MYKVFILNRAKDSKGVSKYKINRLFIRYFAMKFLFIVYILAYDQNFLVVFVAVNSN
ncbi:hypothetical protein SAMN05444484_101642 [Flavobacterium chilense]|uniref:Uncharacterized protein n=1 Tax=Flavobacterium chilense TaxID=946677 RepID=A0A1M6YM81_9FLAO|nr:hypothetical protein SAMN05444484_101642 [Flavobacterium chilense]